MLLSLIEMKQLLIYITGDKNVFAIRLVR